jgi:heat shock protein HslJ
MRRPRRVLTAVVLAGCVATLLPSAAAGQEPSLGWQLVLSEWHLTELDGRPVPRDAGIDLTFWPSGRAAGSGGCNVYASTWTWFGPDRLSFGPISTSRRSCRPGVLRREAAYVERLRSVERFEPRAERLTLITVDGSMLIFAAGNAGPGIIVGPWRLVSLDGAAVPDEVEVSATFDESGTISGSAACNAYSSPYTLDGTAIRTGPVMAQLVSCDEAVMRVEEAYLDALEAATTWSVRGNALRLRARGGEPELEFAAVIPVTFDALTDAGWRLASYGETELARTIGMTAIFGTDGSLTGSAGCNSFTGTYRVDGGSLVIEEVATSSERMCSPEVMGNEAAYLDAMRAVASYKIPENRLRLIAADGLELLFEGSASTEGGPSESQVLADAIGGAVWRLVEASGTDVRALAPITLVLLDDGTVSGVSGCDLYDAAWAVEGDALRFLDATVGGRECAEDVMALQQSYLTVLPFVSGGRLEDGQLVLTLPGSDEGLRFELRAPAP